MCNQSLNFTWYMVYGFNERTDSASLNKGKGEGAKFQGVDQSRPDHVKNVINHENYSINWEKLTIREKGMVLF